MIERVLLVAWKGSAATAWVSVLQSDGFRVLLEDTTGERAWRAAKERGIDLVIIDGQKKPSHGKQTGHALRDTAKTRDIPIIWTNGNLDDEEAVRSTVRPDILLPAPTDAHAALSAIRELEERLREATAERDDDVKSPSPSVSERILNTRAMTAPDPYSNLFKRPTTEEGTLIPATITVKPPPPRKRKVRAWEPVPLTDEPPHTQSSSTDVAMKAKPSSSGPGPAGGRRRATASKTATAPKGSTRSKSANSGKTRSKSPARETPPAREASTPRKTSD